VNRPSNDEGLGAGLTCQVCTRLQQLGKLVHTGSCETAVQALADGHFDLVIICAGRGQEGQRLCAQLNQAAMASPPILVSVPLGDMDTYVACLRTGADVCLRADAAPEEFAATCEALVKRARLRRSANPLTGLPGNVYLHEQLTARLPQRGQLAVLAFDLSDFKAYNDYYGYVRGDRLLMWLASLLEEVVAEHGGEGDFVAHIGGDDLFVVTGPERAEALAQAAIGRFDQGILDFYDEPERQRGGIQSRTRQNVAAFFPLCTLVATGVTNTSDDIQHPGQIAALLAELKEYAKTAGKSIYQPDRRKTHTPLTGPPGEITERRGLDDDG